MPAISGSVVAPPPVASTGGRKSGIVGIWLRAQKYVPIAKAETSITNAETVAVDTRNPRRQWGWAPAPSERAGSFGFLGSWDIGLFRDDSLPGRLAQRGGGDRDDRVETLRRGGGARERHPAHARSRHRDRGRS